MKITRLHVDGFGVWKDLDLAAGRGGLTVIFGPNEAGKTTLLQFMRSVLYGFAPQRRARYLPPAFGGTPGGSLHVESPDGPVRIARHWLPSAGGKGNEELILSHRDGRPLENTELSTLLGGVDERVFENVFAVGLGELQELATLKDTEAARQLYELAGGFDRVSLGSVNRRVRSEREALLGESPSQGEIPQLLAERTKLRDRVGALENSARQWAGLQASRHELDLQIEQLERELDAQRRDARLYQAAEEVRGLWQQRRSLEEQLELLGPMPELAPDAAQRIAALGRRRQSLKKQYRKMKAKSRDIRRQAAGLTASDGLIRNAARIEALYEQRAWIASLHEQCQKLEGEVADLEQRLTVGDELLGEATKSGHPVEVSPRLIAELKPVAQEIHEQRKLIRQATEAAESARQKSSAHQQQLASALGGQGATLLEKIEQQGEVVTRLRRRIEIDDRLEQVVRQRDELEEQSQQLAVRQVLPGWVLGALGGLFALGVMLILIGIFASSLGIASTAGWLLAVLGLGGLGAAIGTKFYLERSTARQLEETRYQLDTLALQTTRLNEEKAELDQVIASGGGPLATQLQNAQRELARLEAFLPQSAELEAAGSSVRSAEERERQANEALAEALKTWRHKLARAGLPSSLSPKALRELATQSRVQAGLRRQRDDKVAELAQRRRELSTSADRISHIMGELHLQPASPSPLAQLEQLHGELSGVAADIARREQLRVRFQRVRRRMAKCRRLHQRLGRRRESLLRAAGATDESQLARITEKLSRAADLRERCGLVKQEIAAIAGGHVSEAALAQVLNLEDRDSHGRLRTASNRLEQAEARHRRLLERRGELKGQLQGLLDPVALPAARLELASLETRLDRVRRRWQVLAVAGHGLAQVQRQIEQTRQPAVLAEASRYFQELTFGQYTRIWTPWDEDTLKVDSAAGETLPLEALSQGTREQIFLSLRLALASWYARRGTPLPLVLDDVLVNFDQKRAAAAARVLAAYAQSGQQVFVFTCHEHIMALFQAMDVGVINLPDYHSPARVRAIQSQPAPELVVAALEPAPTPLEIEEEPEEGAVAAEIVPEVEEEEVLAAIEIEEDEIEDEAPAEEIDEEEEYEEDELEEEEDEEPAGETTWVSDEELAAQAGQSAEQAADDEAQDLEEDSEYEEDEFEEEDESDEEYEDDDEYEEDEYEEEDDEALDEESELDDDDEEEEYEDDEEAEQEEDEYEEDSDEEDADDEEYDEDDSEYEEDEAEAEDEDDEEYEDDEYEENEYEEDDETDEEELDEEEDSEEAASDDDEEDAFDEEEDEEAWDDEQPEAA